MQTDEKAAASSALARHRVTIVAVAAVLFYLGFVQYLWGWRQILGQWNEIGYGPAVLASALLVSTYFARTYRLYDYFPVETKGRFVELFHVAQVHNLLNIMLPFRSGETSFPLLMRSEFGVPLLHGTSALLVMRLLDLHALLAAGGLGLVAASGNRALAGAVWLAFLLSPLLAYQLKAPVLAFAKRRLTGKLLRITQGLEDGLPASTLGLVRAWGMTVLNWGVKVLVLAWVLGLMGVGPIAAAFGGALGGELSSVLPVHAPAGVGTYPAGIVAGAVSLGASTARPAMDILGRASVNLHLILIISALLGTLLSVALSTLDRLRRGG